MFERLKPEDRPALAPYFCASAWPLCEYSLSSVIAWNRCVYEVSWKVDGDLLLLSETDLQPPAARRLLMPLPRAPREIAPAELAELSRRNRHDPFYYIPGTYVEPRRAELEKHFNLTEQPWFMDYIYQRKDLAELAGHKYSKKRNLIAQFGKATAGCKVEVQPITPDNAAHCLKVVDAWAKDPDTGPQMDLLACERKAIANALGRLHPLEMSGVTVTIEGEVCGFALGSPLSKETFVLNFEKALDKYKGLYQFLDRELARSLPENYTLINKESDLGKPGLTKTKESYYPCCKEKSYILAPK